MSALWTASTGMKAQLTNIDVISNNLANVNTVGFKKSRASFQDLLYAELRAPGATTGANTMHPTGNQVGTGTRLAGISKDFSAGSLTRTDRELDIAIAGKGFLEIEGPDGESLYSRDGALSLSADGYVVNADGYKIAGLDSPVDSNAKSINFSSSGQVTYIDSQGAEVSVGQIKLAMFLNPSGLSSVGGNLYKASLGSGDSVEGQNPGTGGTGTIQQNFLEMSNVNIVEEMVNLIAAQRAYELNSKGIKAADEMLQTTNDIAR